MALKVCSCALIPERITSAVTKACEAATVVCDVRHAVPVILSPEKYVTLLGHDQRFQGYFAYSHQSAIIKLAAKNKITLILETLVHELVHYEQWRDDDDPLDMDCEQEAMDREQALLRKLRTEIRRRK